jgi:hypothetical protein
MSPSEACFSLKNSRNSLLLGNFQAETGSISTADPASLFHKLFVPDAGIHGRNSQPPDWRRGRYAAFCSQNRLQALRRHRQRRDCARNSNRIIDR